MICVYIMPLVVCRTALHWASKRNHVEIVKHLLESGALPSITNHTGQLPANLTTSQDILNLLTVQSSDSPVKPHANESQDTSFALPFVPNYLRNAPFPYYNMTNETTPPLHTVDHPASRDADLPLSDTSDNTKVKTPTDDTVAKPTVTPFVVKVWIDDAVLSKHNKDSVEVHVKILSERELEPTTPSAAAVVSSSSTSAPPFVRIRSINLDAKEVTQEYNDFIEVDLEDMTYQGLLKVCCKELNVPEDHVVTIRKLPNVQIRNDNDVKRFKEGQELEIVFSANTINF